MTKTIQICANENMLQGKASKTLLIVGAVSNILGAIIIFASIFMNTTEIVKSVGLSLVGFGWAILAYASIKARQTAKHNSKEGE